MVPDEIERRSTISAPRGIVRASCFLVSFFGSCGSATARIGSASDVVGGTHGEPAVLGGGRYSANPGPKAAVGLLKPSRSVSQHACP